VSIRGWRRHGEKASANRPAVSARCKRDSGIAGAELLVVDVRMRNRFLRQRRMGF